MTTKEFIEKLAKDEVLAKKMESCKSPEEAYEAAKEEGLTDDFEAFKTIMTAENKQIKGELSDNELDNIAGGCGTGEAIAMLLDSDDEALRTTGLVMSGVAIGTVVSAAAGSAAAA